MITAADLAARPVALDDAEAVADILTACEPDEPHDPAMLRHFWTAVDADWVRARWVLERGGAPVGFVRIEHALWENMPQRYGHHDCFVHPDAWSEARFAGAIAMAEAHLESDGARIAAAWVRETRARELDLLLRAGYREERRARYWELDLAGRGPALREMAEASRRRMREAGIEILTAADADPGVYRDLHRNFEEAAADEPTTVPFVPSAFETFMNWFAGPDAHPDRTFFARKDGGVVGISMLNYPPARGNVWTGWTGTARSVRGQGVARALKLETLLQAIDLGVERVRTGNDGANAPILHLNEAFGYRPIPGAVELHRRL